MKKVIEKNIKKPGIRICKKIFLYAIVVTVVLGFIMTIDTVSADESDPTAWAVIITGGISQGSNNARYWNDISEMYEILTDTYCYDPEEVFVLYADGEVPSATNCPDPENIYTDYPTDIIDYSATSDDLKTVCTNIAENGHPDDTLFVFTTDHGGLSGSDISTLCLWDIDLEADTFAGDDYFGQITQYRWRAFIMEQCHSGGFVDYLSDSDTAIATACTKAESSYGMWPHPPEPYYDEFCYHFCAALKGETPTPPGGVTAVDADADNDGRVSFVEAYNYAEDNDKFAPPGYESGGTTYIETPQYDGDGDLGELIFLDDSIPPLSTLSYGLPYYTDGTNEWITTATDISLTATDIGLCSSGVKDIYYHYGAGWIIESGDSAIFNIPEECQHIIQYYAVDNLGNIESTKSTIVRVDDTPPTTTLTYGTPYYSDGTDEWITTATEITLTTTDGGLCSSGIYGIWYNYGAGWMFISGDTGTFTIPTECQHTIQYYAVDNLGNQESMISQDVDVDDTPPEITLLEPIILWSPNHKYHTVEVSDFVEAVEDNKLPVSINDIVITSVSSDEPENDLDDNGDDEEGDGDTQDDIVFIDVQTIKLRKERHGGRDGRVYTINIEVQDLLGNTATESFQVHVQLNKKDAAIDSGIEYIVNSPY